VRKITDEKIFRLLDANFNRSKEGLRVCEDIARFIFDNKAATKHYKALRHQIEGIFGRLSLPKKNVIKARAVKEDVGQGSSKSEFLREEAGDIFYANSQRAKESLRVLEEFIKLTDVRFARDFKKIRYQLYILEKKIVERL